MSHEKTLLNETIEHLSLDTFNPVQLVDAMEKMAFQARNTARAAKIYERMLNDADCSISLCLAGSLGTLMGTLVSYVLLDALVAERMPSGGGGNETSTVHQGIVVAQ